jgi:hypothetical protein
LRKLRESDSCIESMANCSSQGFDSAMLNCTQNFELATKPYAHDPSSAKYSLGLPHYARAPPTSFIYTERLSHSREIMVQEQVGEHSSRIRPKNTELFCYVLCQTGEDVCKALACYLAHGIFGSKDFGKSAVWSKLREFDAVLKTPEGGDFIEKHRNYPNVAHNLMMCAQNIVCPYVMMAKNLEHRENAAENRPIATQDWESAGIYGDQIIALVRSMVFAQALAPEFSITPATFAFFTENSGSRRQHAGTPSTALSGERYNRDQSRRQDQYQPPHQRQHQHQHQHQQQQQNPRPSQQNLQQEKQKSRGIFEYTGGDRNVPFPQIVVKHKISGKTTQFCGRNLYKNMLCPRTESVCGLYHVSDLSGFALLPTLVQTGLKKFVNENNNVQWVNAPQNAQSGNGNRNGNNARG